MRARTYCRPSLLITNKPQTTEVYCHCLLDNTNQPSRRLADSHQSARSPPGLIGADYHRPVVYSHKRFPVSTGWLLGSCMEAQGKQDLWVKQKPEALTVLRKQAIIQSVESSNRIEGVTIPADRLRPVVLGRARPRDRSEEELAGRRRALDWIFSRERPVLITPAVVKRLHAFAQGGFPGDAG